jgi:IS5 family transposase
MNYISTYIYYLCDEFLKAISYKDDPQVQMSTAEVLTFAIIGAKYFGANYRITHLILREKKYFKKLLSPGRIVQRLHKIPEEIFKQIFALCSKLFTKGNSEYIVDSFPILVCQNSRILRCKLFNGKEYHGYTASKNTYFFGIKVHLITTDKGFPVEFVITPGACSDIKGFRKLDLDFESNSIIYADKAYTDYKLEDFLNDHANIKLIAHRKCNSKRQHDLSTSYLLSKKRKRIETSISQIVKNIPRKIHAINAKGFMIKVFLFILAYTFTFFMPNIAM